MPENTILTEIHGCIVCAKLFAILVEYAPDGKLVDCKVTSAGGIRVPDANHPLVACETHFAKEITAGYQRWVGATNFDRTRDED